MDLAEAEMAAPALLKKSPAAFNAAGLAVSRHEAVSSDGTRIPYVQVGRYRRFKWAEVEEWIDANSRAPVTSIVPRMLRT